MKITKTKAIRSKLFKKRKNTIRVTVDGVLQPAKINRVGGLVVSIGGGSDLKLSIGHDKYFQEAVVEGHVIRVVGRQTWPPSLGRRRSFIINSVEGVERLRVKKPEKQTQPTPGQVEKKE